jgi:hypothetical protein
MEGRSNDPNTESLKWICKEGVKSDQFHRS